MDMPYKYLEHGADMGIRAEGSTLEEAFESGAEAMLGIMFELQDIKEYMSVSVWTSARDIPLLFVETLNELLSIQSRDGLALKRLRVDEIKKTDRGFELRGRAFGEGFNKERHRVKTEVKAATYSGLGYEEKREGGYVLQCVVDV